jgi:LmbE family N-acetylglucosaminyl deacetylase
MIKIISHLKYLVFPCIILIALVFFITRDDNSQVIIQFPKLSLDEHKKLLVLAPHCDDETLGSAGLITEALRIGMEVRVVMETNGDGTLSATMRDFYRLYPRPQDFIRMGNLRQQETLNALKLLGVSENYVYFLSYPDHGTASLWNEYWSSTNPFRSPYSNDTHSPYVKTYNPNAVYSGESLLADLESILRSYQPDLISYPHPDDVHPDHWGLSVFTRLALALIQREQPSYQPDAYSYIVHRPDFPYPAGYHPTWEITPPPAMIPLNLNWFSFPLNSEDITLKQAAVLEYKSQLPFLRKLMEGFVRVNELFEQPHPVTLSTLGSGNPLHPSLWQDKNGLFIAPVQRDPIRDFATRDILGAADLTDLYAVLKEPDTLMMCAKLRSITKSGLTYSLYVTGYGPNGNNRIIMSNKNSTDGEPFVVLSDHFACGQIELSSLGNPWMIFLSANVEEASTGILDQVAWQLVEIGP